MHSPSNGKRISFPIQMKPYMVAEFNATADELCAALGEPHFVETDSTRTFGGNEQMWAWELPTGQRLLIVLRVPCHKAVLYCDPPDLRPATKALGIHAEIEQLRVFEKPVVDPCYVDPETARPEDGETDSFLGL